MINYIFRKIDNKIQAWDLKRRIKAAINSEPKRGKVQRNEPCPCGNGKKFKHCHGIKG